MQALSSARWKWKWLLWMPYDNITTRLPRHAWSYCLYEVGTITGVSQITSSKTTTLRISALFDIELARTLYWGFMLLFTARTLMERHHWCAVPQYRAYSVSRYTANYTMDELLAAKHELIKAIETYFLKHRKFMRVYSLRQDYRRNTICFYRRSRHYIFAI